MFKKIGKDAKSPDLKVCDTMAVAGRKILQVQFARMLKREPGTRSGRDIEDLHRMRVATRRMRTAFEILGKYYRKKKIKPIVKGLRKTGRALGRVRDYDVLIQKTSSFFLSGLPENSLEHEPLIKIWLEERNIARIKMLVYLDSSKYKIFKKRFKDFGSRILFFQMKMNGMIIYHLISSNPRFKGL
jgi:CHAD domain-containing protein